MDSNDGRVPSAPGSRKPSPEGLGPTGFDPSREEYNGTDPHEAEIHAAWQEGYAAGLREGARRSEGTSESPPPDDFDRGPWIKWPGGPCPVAPETLIDVRWNNGAVSRLFTAGALTNDPYDMWQSRAASGHVIAYRIVDVTRDSDGPRMAETAPQARGEAGPARAEGIAPSPSGDNP